MSMLTPETYQDQVWDTTIFLQRLNDTIKVIIISYTDSFKLVRVNTLHCSNNYKVVIN